VLVKQIPSQPSAGRHQSGDVSITAITTFLIAVSPKCPLCWMALMSSMGAASVISARWLQPLAIALLLTSILALFVRTRRRSFYGPLLLGLLAALTMYLCKFRFDYDAGLYVSAAALFVSSIWSALPRRMSADPCTACSPGNPLDHNHLVESSRLL